MLSFLTTTTTTTTTTDTTTSSTCTYHVCERVPVCTRKSLNQRDCPANECRNDADCSGSLKYSCNTSTWRCDDSPSGSYSSYSSCQAACKPSSSTPTTTTTLTRYACNQENGTCYSNPNGPYSSIASCENNCFRKPCTIDIFTINDKDTSPIRVWVTQLNQGHWSASDYCDNCNISCSPYPDCLWQKDNIGTGGPGAIYQFKLKEYGSYTYTLTCFNSFGDRPSETLQVNAVNLPWWREIVPVLPGSLWGIIKK